VKQIFELFASTKKGIYEYAKTAPNHTKHCISYT